MDGLEELTVFTWNPAGSADPGPWGNFGFELDPSPHIDHINSMQLCTSGSSLIHQVRSCQALLRSTDS